MAELKNIKEEETYGVNKETDFSGLKISRGKLVVTSLSLALIMMFSGCSFNKGVSKENKKIVSTETPSKESEKKTPIEGVLGESADKETPTAEETKQPEVTPETLTDEEIFEVKGIEFDKETSNVIIGSENKIIFNNCKDYKTVSEVLVSFYSNDLGATVLYEDGAIFVEDPVYNVPRAGFMLEKYPYFENKEAALKYFIDQGDLYAALVAKGEVEVPYNEFGKLKFSEEIQQRADKISEMFSDEAKESVTEISKYLTKYMTESGYGAEWQNPYLFGNLTLSQKPFSPDNYTGHMAQMVNKELYSDQSEGYIKSQKLFSSFKGISIAFILGAFYEGDINENTQEEFTQYLTRFSEIAMAMEGIRLSMNQEAFDKVVNLVENNDCPAIVAGIANMYFGGVPTYIEAMTPNGIVKMDDVQLNYRGEILDFSSAKNSFSSTMGKVQNKIDFGTFDPFTTSVEEVMNSIQVSNKNTIARNVKVNS